MQSSHNFGDVGQAMFGTDELEVVKHLVESIGGDLQRDKSNQKLSDVSADGWD